LTYARWRQNGRNVNG